MTMSVQTKSSNKDFHEIKFSFDCKPLKSPCGPIVTHETKSSPMILGKLTRFPKIKLRSLGAMIACKLVPVEPFHQIN
jgi:hypothetical protein